MNTATDSASNAGTRPARRVVGIVAAGLLASATMRLLAMPTGQPVPQLPPLAAKPFDALLLPARTFFRADASRVADRMVFAWYLPCCGAFGGNEAAGASTAPNPGWPAGPLPAPKGVEEYRRAIMLARAAGYNGFALDEFATAVSLTTSDRANIAAIFEAAREIDPGFKLYFVFDETAHDARDYRDLLAVYANHPNYFRYRGLPVASAYSPARTLATVEASARWWAREVIAPASSALGTPIFWVPVSESAQAERCLPPLAAWSGGPGAARALGAWQIQTAPIGGGLPCQEHYAEATRAGGLAWVGTYSWHYWVSSYRVIPSAVIGADADGPGRVFEHGGGMGLALSWASLIGRQSPAWVTMLTANDFQESYGETVDDYRHYREQPGNGIPRFTPPGWYQDQSGMADLNRYYLQWYRSGRRPEIVTDALFANYRTLPEGYRVPTRNDFIASVDDGAGGAGETMTVSAVAAGYVVPGEVLHGDGVEGATILDQINGTPYGAGRYRISQRARSARGAVHSFYRAVPPVFERNGEPADPIYVTAAVARDGAVFAAAADAARYRRAVVDGRDVALPVRLSSGLHQIRIAPFAPGLPRFTLSRSARPQVELVGRPILAGGPVYDGFPATARAYAAVP